MLAAAGLLAGACTGGLSERSYADVAGQVPIRQEVTRVRIEVQDGRIQVDHGDAREVAYRGGVRRAADTRSDLDRLEQLPLELTAAPDATDPTVLVLRGPVRGGGDPPGVFAYELGVHVPGDLALEVHVLDNGEVTVVNRRAATEVVTGRGDLRFDSCHGELRARTGRGNVIVNEHRGDLDVLAKVGNMQAFVAAPGQQLRLTTGEGTVQCHVPRQLDFEIDARAETGKISATAFALASESVGRFGAVLTGARGTGRTKIVLRTGAGHLSLSPLPD